jgi:tetratricopeptide (TPR) repeat protein
MTEWYRRKTWTEADESEFFTKLSRARKDGRAQYLKIQAMELVETREQTLLNVAESLIDKLFSDYPEDKFNRPGALTTLAEIYELKGNLDKSIDYYKQAIDFEVVYPQVKTQAYLNYSELIVKTNKTSLFDDVEKIILDRLSENFIPFPIEKYKQYSILSIVNKYKHNFEQAKQYEELAEKYANQETSGLRYHKYLGVVKERDSWLDRLLKRK